MLKNQEQYADIITEVRENFQYASDAWRDIREEAKKDMACVAGDTWDPSERSRREDPKQSRPCLCLDECTQYLNQEINGVRQAKRSIHVIPRGSGANDKEAELRGNIIRDIEYDSQAQAAYITGFENAIQRSYGWLRVTTARAVPGKPEKKIVIRRIANPDTVYPDPDYREADSSDKAWCFVIDYMSRKKFKREFPDAAYQNFTSEQMVVAPTWIKPNHVQVAEYWKREKFKDGTIKVTQYLTNGLEVLEENEWPGKYIPLVLFVGKELWVDDEGGSRRIWESLVRKARDPQQLLNYSASTEAEVIRMVPKTPFVAAKGQIVNPEEWQKVNDTPLAYLIHDPYAGNAGGQAQPLPPPSRPAYDPPVQQLEIAKESAKRSIQAAMGISPLPTQAQRRNEKSGIALEKIQDETQQGSFHFVDNYERGLMFCGRIINDLLFAVYDTPRDVGVRHKDESHHVIRINEKSQDENGQPVAHLLSDGEYDVTISTGPSYQSEREQANEFSDGMLEIIGTLPVDPSVKAKLVALSITMKDLGAIGEEMAELIAPKQPNAIPPQAQAQIASAQQELQLAQATIAQLMQEKVARHAELANKLAVAKLQADKDIAVAEISTKAQNERQRDASYADILKMIHDAAHEVGMSQLEHGQDLAQGDQAAQIQANQVAQQSPVSPVATQ